MVGDPVKRDLILASVAGLATAGVAAGGAYSLGRISGFEAMALMEASLPTTRFLASAVMTSSATVLALMLTLLSFSSSAEFRLSSLHYSRVKGIALVVCISFVVSTLFLLLLNIPLGETDRVPNYWYDTLYYSVITTAAGLSGVIITVVLMLYLTVRAMIETIVGEEPGWIAHEQEAAEGDDGEPSSESAAVTGGEAASGTSRP